MPASSPAPMTYVEVEPPPDLAPWIAAFWCFRVAPDAGAIEHRIPLTGGLLLSVGPNGLPLLAGPRVEPLVTEVRGGDVYRGIHVLPGAAPALFHLAPGSLRDAAGPAALWLDPQWCARLSAAAALPDDSEALAGLAAAVRDLAPRAAPCDPAVQAAVRLLLRAQGTARAEELARAAALSPRQLRRRFQAAVGLSPKELARLRRLRASAAAVALHERPWAEVAAEGGYADQPHLVHEFRRLLGVTPGDFERHARRIDHRLVGD